MMAASIKMQHEAICTSAARGKSEMRPSSSERVLEAPLYFQEDRQYKIFKDLRLIAAIEVPVLWHTHKNYTQQKLSCVGCPFFSPQMRMLLILVFMHLNLKYINDQRIGSPYERVNSTFLQHQHSECAFASHHTLLMSIFSLCLSVIARRSN